MSTIFLVKDDFYTKVKTTNMMSLEVTNKNLFDAVVMSVEYLTSDFVLSNIEVHANRIGAGIVYISHDQTVVDRCDTVIALSNKLKRETEERNAA